MPQPVKILAFAGSLRAGSHNRRLVELAAAAARAAGAQTTLLDLRERPLPLYDADLEAREGLPAAARELKQIFKAHDGLLIASPEYNSGFTPALKNLLDWLSRREPDEAPLAAFAGKVAALCSASTGELGGLRGLALLRPVLAALQVTALPEQVAVPRAAEAFGADGKLADPRRQAAVEALAARLLAVTGRLTG